MTDASPSVEIYTTRYCPYCVSAKALLTRKGISFKELDVSADADLRAEMTRRSHGGMTVPQIFIGDTHVGGSDDLYALEAARKLDSMLAAGEQPPAADSSQSQSQGQTS
jgi:glutaredoxin 3